MKLQSHQIFKSKKKNVTLKKKKKEMIIYLKLLQYLLKAHALVLIVKIELSKTWQGFVKAILTIG